jgi:hypothetical protein
MAEDGITVGFEESVTVWLGDKEETTTTAAP